MDLMLLDEHLGQVRPAGQVSFTKARASVRELIRARVELEIERQRDEGALALAGRAQRIVPGPAETALNGDRGAYGLGALFVRTDGEDGRRRLDAMVAEAERGFASGRYYVLLDDRQAESLDEMVDLDRTGEATFLLLTPLQGG